MRSLVDLTRQWQRLEGVLAVSIIHGFPWGDVAHLGTKSLIVTDARKELGSSLARDLAARLRALRGRTANDVVPYEVALSSASRGPRTIVADVADNPGGGAAGDSTYLLRALLEKQVPAAFGPLWDPLAVSIAQKAGVGARLRLRLGGKVSRASGEPLDAEVTVSGVADSLRTPGVGGYDVTYGRSVWLRAETVDIVVTSEREQAMVPDMFTRLGIVLADKQIVVLKSAQHFVAGFHGVAPRILYASSPGTLDPDFARLPYVAADLTLWPLKGCTTVAARNEPDQGAASP
jgi:microcystin degradation protein MlrC